MARLAALLGRAGFKARVSEQIQQDSWYKLWGNMSVNLISALTGATTDLILTAPTLCPAIKLRRLWQRRWS